MDPTQAKASENDPSEPSLAPSSALDASGCVQAGRPEGAPPTFEDRYYALGRATGSMVWTTDADGHDAEMPDWSPVTGQTMEKSRKAGWLNQVHPDDREPTMQIWTSAVQNQTPYHAEYRLQIADGGFRWYRARGVPIIGTDGKTREWVGLCEDIDAQKRNDEEKSASQAALRQSEERYRQTFDNAAVGIAHVGLDGTVLRVNDALCQIIGYTREELCEKTFHDMTHPDDAERDWDASRRLAAGEISLYQTEKRYIHKSGRYVWANITASLMRDDGGRPLNFISIVEDIGAHKAAELALMESEDHYRFMVDTNPQMPWTADADGQMTDFSDRWLMMVNMSRAETRDEGWLQVLHPDDARRMRDAWYASVACGGVYDFEHRARTADGSYRWMRSRAVPRRDASGRIIRWYGSTEDIDKQKHVETNLERLVEQRTAALNEANEALITARDAALAAAKSKSEFLANMSHEIRTPMNGVIGLTSLLLRMKLDPEAHAMVETISSSGETLLRVIDDILDLSRIDANKLEIERTRVDVDQLCADVIALFQGHAQAKSVALRCAPPHEKAPRVLADSVRLRQVLSNLIANGVKFTDKGEVTLSWNWMQDSVGVRMSFNVADTGAGIPEDRTIAVFESFTQADGSTQRRFGGTGLGLTISKRLVELMGGSISVKSDVGVGTSFTVELSFETAPVWSEEAQGPDSGASQATVRNVRVLLAEDNAVNILVARRLLEHCGCEVDVAENGLRAIAMASSGNYDLVLMDVQMPTCDGLEATRVIRMAEARDGRRRLPVYALTANAMRGDREECLAAGMDGFLAKPIPLAALQAVLNEIQLENPCHRSPMA